MDNTELILDELENLKGLTSSVYRDRLRNARSSRPEAAIGEDEETRLCPSCGEEIPADSEACPKCGASVSRADEEARVEQVGRRSRFDEGLARR